LAGVWELNHTSVGQFGCVDEPDAEAFCVVLVIACRCDVFGDGFGVEFDSP